MEIGKNGSGREKGEIGTNEEQRGDVKKGREEMRYECRASGD